jgi:hypothetical protein
MGAARGSWDVGRFERAFTIPILPAGNRWIDFAISIARSAVSGKPSFGAAQ